MEGCLAVNAIGKSGGLAMMWKESIKVEIKNYSNNHIDCLIHLENDKVVHFKGYYGNGDPKKRQSSWDMLRKVGSSIKVIHQSSSNHDVIFLDIEGHKPKERTRDPRLNFDTMSTGLKRMKQRILSKMHGRTVLWISWKKLRIWVKTWVISSIINTKRCAFKLASNKIKAMRLKLGKLHENEEKYWAQRLRITWLKEDDRNTHFST
ncbi:hypothetical protein GOBAR_AA19910 [Gossypium barbadense]|uniref:Uncharacterized protein n=1 Tax=Gossypium barbadense TaxID=3634 RepID=A0A2P5XBR0_GOSBA|nr:hypothetical protein GOBAR_AA19910 [Gossypium barbadense]